ncbi:MAG: heat-inducible transcriptional repressor HrcA [Polyangiales bacterium]
MAHTELNARARKILYAAVTEFIATGEPVGSRTLSRKYSLELSAASIRNVLADLEEAGYFHQPHASSGRVPSDRAFRLFIDALMQVREVSVDQRTEIEQRFEGLGPRANVLRETARLLAGMTGTAAVIVAPRLELHALKQLRFIGTRPGEMLAVIVTATGYVENRFLRVDLPPSNDELTRIHNLLDDVLEGRTLREVRELFARRLHDERNELGALRRRAFELGDLALKSSPTSADGSGSGNIEVVIEGQAQLLDKPEFADVDRIKQLVRVLEERERLIGILDKTLDTQGVHVVLPGEEAASPLGIEQLSLVSARYALDGLGGHGGPVAGSIGVIGPTRMDYASIVPIVHETARQIGAYLARRDGLPSRDDDEEH